MRRKDALLAASLGLAPFGLACSNDESLECSSSAYSDYLMGSEPSTLINIDFEKGAEKLDVTTEMLEAGSVGLAICNEFVELTNLVDDANDYQEVVLSDKDIKCLAIGHLTAVHSDFGLTTPLLVLCPQPESIS